MDKLRARYEAIGNRELNKRLLSDDGSFECSMGIVPGKDGQPVPGFWFLVQLKHNKLLGQPPIVSCIPVPAVNIADEAIENLAAQLLEDSRQRRDEMNSAPVQLPGGLRGMKLGG